MDDNTHSVMKLSASSQVRVVLRLSTLSRSACAEQLSGAPRVGRSNKASARSPAAAVRSVTLPRPKCRRGALTALCCTFFSPVFPLAGDGCACVGQSEAPRVDFEVVKMRHRARDTHTKRRRRAQPKQTQRGVRPATCPLPTPLSAHTHTLTYTRRGSAPVQALRFAEKQKQENRDASVSVRPSRQRRGSEEKENRWRARRWEREDDLLLPKRGRRGGRTER